MKLRTLLAFVAGSALTLAAVHAYHMRSLWLDIVDPHRSLN